MNKHEIYEALKADGAKLPKAERFMALDDLTAIYTERFGVSPDERVKKMDVRFETPQSQPAVPKKAHASSQPDRQVRLLRFIESGWCPALNRSYTRGLYRPRSFEEYLALKPYAKEVV